MTNDTKKLEATLDARGVCCCPVCGTRCADQDAPTYCADADCGWEAGVPVQLCGGCLRPAKARGDVWALTSEGLCWDCWRSLTKAQKSAAARVIAGLVDSNGGAGR
jgi:hypothetical protein